jgi:hypothetical protein
VFPAQQFVANSLRDPGKLWLDETTISAES